MQKIAFERFSTWFSEAWEEFTRGMANLLPWGALVFGLNLLQQFASAPAQAFAGISQVIFAGLMLLSIVIGFVAQGVAQCGITGVALARWHGREATFDDFKLDLSTHVQGVLGFAISKVLAGLLTVLAASPGIGLIIAGVAMGDDTGAFVILGIILLLLLAIPVAVITGTLFLFTMPLIVDKRLDFWSAMRQSVDCTRRDLGGLVFYLIVYALLMTLLAIPIVCTCGLGTIFVVPFAALIDVRVYRDYFGLEEDHVEGHLSQYQPVPAGPSAGPFGDSQFRPGGFAPAPPPPEVPLPPPPPGLSYGPGRSSEPPPPPPPPPAGSP